MDHRAANRPAIGHSNVRDPCLDGLLTAEDRDGHDVEVAESVVQARELAQAHLRRCASAGYWHTERRAARCATMAVRQGNGALDNPRESVLADLLRRRSRFVEVPVVEVDGSFDAVDAPQSGATMLTSVGEEMHRKLAMQSRDDAKAYLEMLNEEGVLMPPTSATAAVLPGRSRELHAGGMVQEPGVMHSLRFAAPLGAGLHSCWRDDRSLRVATCTCRGSTGAQVPQRAARCASRPSAGHSFSCGCIGGGLQCCCGGAGRVQRR